MPKNIPLKYRFIFGGIATVFIPFFIAGIIIYLQLSSSLLNMTEEKAVLIAKDISNLIDATLMQEISMASAIAADPDIIEAAKTGNYSEAQSELEAIYKRIGMDLFTIFLLDKNGISRAEALYSQQIGLDLSNRDYFLMAKQGRTSVSGPLFARGSATPGESIIVVSAPIQEGNEFYGLVALPFNTDFLVDILSQKKLGQTGFAYMINDEGIVLVHPRKNYILKLRLLDQPGTERMKKLVMDKEAGAVSYSIDGAEKIAGLARVNLTDWTVVFSQTRDEIMSPVNKTLYAILISAIVFLFVIIAIIIVFTSKISTPIQKMMEMLKQVTRHSTEIILQIGLDRQIIFANPAFEKITGLKSADITGSEPILDNTNNISPDAIWSSLETGVTWSGRLVLKTTSHDAITLEAMIVPFKDESGSIQGYLEIGRDITSELMYEKRMQQSQKLEAVGTLAGGIAHDFNNILSGIFGYAELSLMKKKYDPAMEKYIREIIKASERARDLVSQILTFSRQTEVELKPLLPKSVLKEALKLLRASIPATITIQSKINSNSAIMAEPTQIHQVVMNLFTNAVHAIGDNAGTITLELDDFMVDEEFTRTHPDIIKGKHVILRVSDTGSGIDHEVLDHIFEPFFTTKSHGKGTGLGLSVVHGIVKNLGGIITTYSEVGKGTVFNIIIPCTQRDDSILHKDELLPREGTERIAVVDDETAITTTMQSILTNLGYSVKSFTDSMEALRALETNLDDFDLVITDYSMPRITGLEIAKRLKEKGADIPIILTSGYLDKNIEDAARNTGIAEIIIKPINTYQLTDAIHRVLRKI